MSASRVPPVSQPEACAARGCKSCPLAAAQRWTGVWGRRPQLPLGWHHCGLPWLCPQPCCYCSRVLAHSSFLASLTLRGNRPLSLDDRFPPNLANQGSGPNHPRAYSQGAGLCAGKRKKGGGKKGSGEKGSDELSFRRRPSDRAAFGLRPGVRRAGGDAVPLGSRRLRSQPLLATEKPIREPVHRFLKKPWPHVFNRFATLIALPPIPPLLL